MNARALAAALLLCAPVPALATTYQITGTFTGASEGPPTTATGTGTFTGTYNDATLNLSFSLIFVGLTTNATAAHLHGPAPANINAAVLIPFSSFPAATSGTYSNSYTLTAL